MIDLKSGLAYNARLHWSVRDIMTAPHAAGTSAAPGAQTTVIKIIAIQLAVTVLVAIVAMVVGGVKPAYSALVGGGINIVTTAYFARRVFAARPGATAKRMVRAFYVGEVTKILLTVALFTLALLWLELAFLPLFTAYALTMLAFWLALLVTL